MTPVRIEKVLNELDYNNLANFILPDETSFPWYYYADSAYKNGGEQIFQFVHNIYRDAKPTTLEWLYNTTLKVISKLPDIIGDKEVELYRAKFNLLPRQIYKPDDLILSKHVDRDEDGYISMVYYIEDSDGDTVLYDNHHEEKYRFTPKANTCIIFKSNTWHRATPPTNNKVRRVLNIVVKVL